MYTPPSLPTIPIAQAYTTESKPLSTIGLISHYSELYDVSSSTVYKVLKCESNLSPSAIGDNGTSYGIAQINLPSHPEISKKQALDPTFAIPWMIKEFSLGYPQLWSCYNNLQVMS